MRLDEAQKSRKHSDSKNGRSILDMDFRYPLPPPSSHLPASSKNDNSKAPNTQVIVHCNFFRKVRLGGWGTKGPQAPRLGTQTSACATILRLCALQNYVACTTMVGCVRYYVVCAAFNAAQTA